MVSYQNLIVKVGIVTPLRILAHYAVKVVALAAAKITSRKFRTRESQVSAGIIAANLKLKLDLSQQ